MTEPMDLQELVHEIAVKARARLASGPPSSPRREKDAWLLRAAQRLEAARERIRAANALDVAEARAKGIDAPLASRLELSDAKWRDMIAGLRDVAALPDPVGRVEQTSVRPNGLEVGRMRIPLGVIGMIYESRPNVTVDAAALCVKAGNAVILRGGSEALRSNLALAEELRAAARDCGLPEDAVAVIPRSDREAIDHLLREDALVDLIIPRGGPGADPQGHRDLAHPGDQARRGRVSRVRRRERRRRDGARDRARLEAAPDGGVQRARDAARARRRGGARDAGRAEGAPRGRRRDPRRRAHARDLRRRGSRERVRLVGGVPRADRGGARGRRPRRRGRARAALRDRRTPT